MKYISGSIPDELDTWVNQTINDSKGNIRNRSHLITLAIIALQDKWNL